MPRSISRCPNCGEPVSQFAAGCAVCGFDLEAHRAQLAARRSAVPGVVRRIQLPQLSADEHVTRLIFAIALTLFVPFFGLFLAAWFAYLADKEGRDAIRNALIAVCGFAFVMLYVAPFSIWGVLLGL